MEFIKKIKKGRKYYNVFLCECGLEDHIRADYKRLPRCKCQSNPVCSSRFYDHWRGIKKRSKSYCKEWQYFRTFEKWALANFKEGFELICLDHNKHYSPETCKFVSKKESQKINSVSEKRKNTLLEKYGKEHYSQTDQFKRDFKSGQTEESNKKRQETFLKKYGVENISQNETVKNKIKETNIKKYGCECVFQNDSIKEKIKQANISNLGVEYPTQSQEIKDKIVDSNIKKFGKSYYTQTEEYKEKAKNTSINNCGEEHHTKTKEYKNKIRSRLKENKTFKLYDNKLLSELCEEKNITQDPLRKRIKKYGLKIALEMKKRESGLESFFEDNILIKNNLSYEKQFRLESYIPDFKIGNLLIECDGIYWHSELYKEKDYHKNKREYYIQNGYQPLFFYEDEIINKTKIVESIILNKLMRSKTIGARKCNIVKLNTKDSNKFFTDNHLMGKGSGKTYGLEYNNELVAAIRFRKLKGGLDISRFATKCGYSIVGGFSKLLKAIESHNPEFIQNFVDLRYGSGNHLENFDFKKTTESLSFYWVGNSERLHRMNFPGNTGYEHGLVKLWDCGQRNFVKRF